MVDKAIWTLSTDEVAEISDLFEKKMAIDALLDMSNVLSVEDREKVLREAEKNQRAYNQWWKEMREKYDLVGEKLWVNFATNQIMEKLK